MPAPLVFLETLARFAEGTGLRQDRGNNGYCILRLKADGSRRTPDPLTYSSILDDNVHQVRITRNKAKIRKAKEVDDWCAEFEKLCRSRGIRVTAQRFAVYKALAEDLTHPTAESVYARLSERLPGLSFATIYRTLQFFENEKLIRKVSSPGAIGRFDANVDPHQHLVCRVCGSLEDISIPELHSAAIPNVSGFTVEELDIRLVGRCQACSSSRSKPQMRRAARLRRNQYRSSNQT